MKAGGVLEQVTRELNIEALPTEIPDTIELDVSQRRDRRHDHARRRHRARGRGAARRRRDGRRHAHPAAPLDRGRRRDRDRRPRSSARPAPRARPPPRATPRTAASSRTAVVRLPGRRASTGWSSGSATRAPSTPARATTSASRSRTCWRRAGASRARSRSTRACSTEGACRVAGRRRRPPRVAVLLPQTYMNESGRSVGPARGALRVPLERVLVLHDEIDLPFGDDPHADRRRARRPQRAQVVEARAGLGRLRSRADRRRPAADDRPRPGRRLRARSLPRAGGRCRGAGCRVRRRGGGDRARERSARSGGGGAAPCPPRERSATDAHPPDVHSNSTGRAALRGRSACPQMLSALLAYAADDPATAALAARGGRAFVSQSLKPYVVAALAQRGSRQAAARRRRRRPPRARPRGRPQDVARAAAGPLLPESRRHVRVAPRAAAAPRRPARRRARRAARRRRGSAASTALPSSSSPPSRCRRRCRTRDCARTASCCEKGDLLDLDECAADLVAAGYERVEQVEDRGQFAIRGGLLDVFPATEDHAIRVDMFDVEIESLRWFSTFTQRSLGDVEQVEIAPGRRAGGRAPRAGRDRGARRRGRAARRRRAAARRRLPRDARPRARRGRAGRRRGGDRARTVDHWQDVVAAFHDDDAHHLYIAPGAIETALEARAKIRLSAIDQDQPHQFRGQAADVAARSVKDAEPELEKLVRSGYRTVVAFGARGEGERAAYNLGRLKVRWVDGSAPQGADLAFAEARLRDGFVAPGFRLAVIPEHRLFRRRAARTGGAAAGRSPPRRAALLHRPAHRRHRRARGPRPRALRRLRHEDGRGRHARLPEPRVRGHRQGLPAGRPVREDQPLRRRRRRSTRRSRSSAARAGRRSSRAPAEPRRSSPAS